MSTQLTRLRRTAASARVRAALSLGVVTAVGATGTFAYWTDSVTVTGASFTSGNIDLKVNGADTAATVTGLTLTNMVPGSTASGELIVSNTGNTPLKYTASTTASNTTFAAALDVLVTKKTGSTCGTVAVEGSATKLDQNLLSTGRLLAGPSSETLCVKVTLPTTAGNDTQSKSSTLTFSFAASSNVS